jgi:hypothetical protein
MIRHLASTLNRSSHPPGNIHGFLPHSAILDIFRGFLGCLLSTLTVTIQYKRNTTSKYDSTQSLTNECVKFGFVTVVMLFFVLIMVENGNINGHRGSWG